MGSARYPSQQDSISLSQHVVFIVPDYIGRFSFRRLRGPTPKLPSATKLPPTTSLRHTTTTQCPVVPALPLGGFFDGLGSIGASFLNGFKDLGLVNWWSWDKETVYNGIFQNDNIMIHV